MRKLLRLLFDRSLWMFLLIGFGNTFLSLGIMFLLYSSGGMGYWASSAIAFALASVSSFYLNKRFSFHNTEALGKTAIRFSLVIACCYLVAYSVAQPTTAWVLTALNINFTERIVEQLAMLVGQVVFTGLNYFGQRFFAFKKNAQACQ